MQPRRRVMGLVFLPLLAFLLGFAPGMLSAGEDAGQSAAGTQATSKKKKSSKKGTAKSGAAAASKQGAGSKQGSASAKRGSAGVTKAPRTTRSATAGAGAPKVGAKKGTRKGSKKGASKRSAKQPPKQTQPESARIREIQQALNDHGYPLEVNGAWDARSVAALKKFQEDQNIDNLSGRGKLDSMTLIALGLGPKREPPSGLPDAPKRSTEGPIP